MRSVDFGVHAAFASTRSTLSGAISRTTRTMRSSHGDPSLIFSTGYCAASSTRERSVGSSGAMPIVKLVGGDAAGSSPHSL